MAEPETYIKTVANVPFLTLTESPEAVRRHLILGRETA
jgi:hypothetical protein